MSIFRNEVIIFFLKEIKIRPPTLKCIAIAISQENNTCKPRISFTYGSIAQSTLHTYVTCLLNTYLCNYCSNYLLMQIFSPLFILNKSRNTHKNRKIFIFEEFFVFISIELTLLFENAPSAGNDFVYPQKANNVPQKSKLQLNVFVYANAKENSLHFISSTGSAFDASESNQNLAPYGASESRDPTHWERGLSFLWHYAHHCKLLFN